MSKKITVLIDGGHLRSYLKKASKPIIADYIEKIGLASALANEEIVRILYYDCALYNGTSKLPISRALQTHTQTTPYLHDLAQDDLFAVRRGVLKFRGYVIKKNHQPSSPPVDSDFVPKFQQKGVDMRIGLDMATIAANRSVELIALMTNDTDCIPAMKLVRRAASKSHYFAFLDVDQRRNFSPTPISSAASFGLKDKRWTNACIFVLQQANTKQLFFPQGLPLLRMRITNP